MHYAIDFGTSNTVVARINQNGEREIVPIPYLSQANALIPSLVFVENAATGVIIAGQAVQKLPTSSRYFRDFKRAIAQPNRTFVPELDGRPVPAKLVGQWFLQQIIQQLPDLTSLVITVPIDSFEAYRQWLVDICQDLAVPELRILDEPTAAALGYGGYGGKILVIDIGGGTLDLVLVELQIAEPSKILGFFLKWGDRQVNSATRPPIARVIAKVGQELGGIDIDQWLMAYFHQHHGIPQNATVRELAEKIKIALSSSEQAEAAYFDGEHHHILKLGRSQFVEILTNHKFFSRLDRALGQIQNQVREFKDINGVLLVGGTAQIPAVRQWLSQYFPAAKIQSGYSFAAIAYGALDQKFQLQDFLYHSYGIRYWDKRQRRHNWHPLIKAGTQYPTSPLELILGASQPDQPSIELVIGELGETDVEVLFESDRLVTQLLSQAQTIAQPLTEKVIAPLHPLGQPGSDRLRVEFQVDAQRTLLISITDLLTKQNLCQNQAVVKLI